MPSQWRERGHVEAREVEDLEDARVLHEALQAGSARRRAGASGRGPRPGSARSPPASAGRTAARGTAGRAASAGPSSRCRPRGRDRPGRPGGAPRVRSPITISGVTCGGGWGIDASPRGRGIVSPPAPAPAGGIESANAPGSTGTEAARGRGAGGRRQPVSRSVARAGATVALAAGGGRDGRHCARRRTRDGSSGLARSLRGGATASRIVGRGRRRRYRSPGDRGGRGRRRACAPAALAGHLEAAPAPRRPARRPAGRRHRVGPTVGAPLPRPGRARRAHARGPGR